MRHLLFFFLKELVSIGSMLAVSLMLLLSRQPVFAQVYNQVPDELEYQALVDL